MPVGSITFKVLVCFFHFKSDIRNPFALWFMRPMSRPGGQDLRFIATTFQDSFQLSCLLSLSLCECILCNLPLLSLLGRKGYQQYFCSDWSQGKFSSVKTSSSKNNRSLWNLLIESSAACHIFERTVQMHCSCWSFWYRWAKHFKRTWEAVGTKWWCCGPAF